MTEVGLGKAASTRIKVLWLPWLISEFKACLWDLIGILGWSVWHTLVNYLELLARSWKLGCMFVPHVGF